MFPPLTASFNTPFRHLVRAGVLGLLLLCTGGCDGAGDTGPDVPPIASVDIERHETVQLLKGLNLKLRAVATTEAGEARTDLPITWTSSNPAIAQVSESGLVETLARGRVTITASLGGQSDVVEMTVLDISGKWRSEPIDVGIGIELVEYTLVQDGTKVTGQFASVLGFPPLTDEPNGTIEGSVNSTATRFEHTVHIRGSACHLDFGFAMQIAEQPDGTRTMTPETSSVNYTSPNECGTGTLQVAPLTYQ